MATKCKNCSSIVYSTGVCPTTPIYTTNVIYYAPNLPNSGINTEDSVTVALQKIDEKLSAETILTALLAVLDTNPTLKAALCARIGTC